MDHQASNPAAFHFLHAMAERTDQMIFAYQLDTHQFIYVNPSLEQLWQQSRDSIMADPAAILEIIHPEDRDFVKKTYHKIVHGAEQRNLEFRLQLSDLSMRWLCVTPFLLKKEESGQQLLVGSAEDITHNKEHQETLQKFSSKKNAILEILSHDLARPLANIKGLSTLLAKRLKPSGEEEVAELVEMISQASERGTLLIREFIQEEFLASANVELIKERVDIV